MKILTAEQIREADAYTIKNEPIASIDWMERAAKPRGRRIKHPRHKSAKVFCGPGNNGGDGLAVASLIKSADWKVEAYILSFSNKSSEDFTINENRFKKQSPTRIHYIGSKEDIPKLTKEDLIIDAIF